MTEFAEEPYTKVTVRSFMRYENADQYARAMTLNIPRGMGGRAGNLFWANGVVFKHANFSPTESLTKQYLLRHLPIDHLEYAPMPNYQPEINTEGITVTIIDVTNHTLFNSLTKWIKEKIEKRK